MSNICRGHIIAAVCFFALCVFAIISVIYLKERLHNIEERKPTEIKHIEDKEVAKAEEAKKEEKQGAVDVPSGTSKEHLHTPSPQEYLLGIAAHAAAVRSTTTSVSDAKKQRALISDAISQKHKKSGDEMVGEKWAVFCLSWPYRISSLVHALMSEITPNFRLDDAQDAEVRRIVEGEVEGRRASLGKIKEEWPCVATEEWFDRECVKPGPFYTQEFRDRYLLSGIHYQDSENDDRFYKAWFSVSGPPEYLQRLERSVYKCCADVWSDPAVIDGIAELMSSHRFERQEISVTGPDTWGKIEAPSQETVDLICGKMTKLYMDAILRRMSMEKLFMTVAKDAPAEDVKVPG